MWCWLWRGWLLSGQESNGAAGWRHRGDQGRPVNLAIETEQGLLAVLNWCPAKPAAAPTMDIDTEQGLAGGAELGRH